MHRAGFWGAGFGGTGHDPPHGHDSCLSFALQCRRSWDFLELFRACLTGAQRGKSSPSSSTESWARRWHERLFWVPADLGPNGSAASRGGHASCRKQYSIVFFSIGSKIHNPLPFGVPLGLSIRPDASNLDPKRRVSHPRISALPGTFKRTQPPTKQTLLENRRLVGFVSQFPARKLIVPLPGCRA